MTTDTLTDRYVDAAMRTVREDQRADLATELRGSIDDQIEARIAEGADPESAERAVLTNLGDPDLLAAGYTGRQLHLIGPRYYLDWWRLLKLLLWIVLPCAAFGVALGQVLSGATVGETIGSAVVAVLTAALHVTFWTTLVFVVLERTGHESMETGPWTPDRLPEPRQRGAGLGDMIASIAFLLIMAGVVLWDHFIGLVPTEPGLSFLDDGLWPWWITALFAVMALEAVLAIAVYGVGRWTVPLAVANGILNLLIAVPALWLLGTGRLLNPDFFPTIIEGSDGAEVQTIIAAIIGFAIVAVAIWDTTDAALKAARARRASAVLD
ncbi:permease prefix domain 1-containing protein [Microbacterium sp. NPDC058389]|uniref:permease prefix domain 1-containing protein n=1 Tax=Microbacterium sp. NPDC058389 TaxID=3346475 RepID=UPI003664B775